MLKNFIKTNRFKVILSTVCVGVFCVGVFIPSSDNNIVSELPKARPHYRMDVLEQSVTDKIVDDENYDRYFIDSNVLKNSEPIHTPQITATPIPAEIKINDTSSFKIELSVGNNVKISMSLGSFVSFFVLWIPKIYNFVKTKKRKKNAKISTA